MRAKRCSQKFCRSTNRAWQSALNYRNLFFNCWAEKITFLYFDIKCVPTANYSYYVSFLLSLEAQLKSPEKPEEAEEMEADEAEDKSVVKIPTKDVEVETPELRVRRTQSSANIYSMNTD